MRELAPRRFRALVFDWDGTLADSTMLIAGALQNACVALGRPCPSEADARYVIGLGLADALAHVAPGLSADEQRALSAHYRRHYLDGEAAIPLFDGASALLEELDAAGFLLGVATGKTRAGLDRAIAAQRLVGRFHATRCADEGFPKPHPDMLLALMDRLGVQPAETLMIGDTTHDLDLARNAGAHAVAVAYGAHDVAGLESRAPLALVHSIAELKAWLATNG
jgi:phosphoglycolate phosphatase